MGPNDATDPEAIYISSLIGQCIRDAMRANGMSPGHHGGTLGDLADMAGIRESTMNSWHRGDRRAPIEGLMAIDKALNRPTGQMLLDLVTRLRKDNGEDDGYIDPRDAIMAYELLGMEDRVALCRIFTRLSAKATPRTNEPV